MRLVDAATNEGQRALEPVRQPLIDAPSVADAAQLVVRTLHERYAGELVLTRMFAGVPLGTLPPAVREQARYAAEARGGGEVTDESIVLCLLGTYGDRPEWCDRRRSRNHAFIPFVDEASVRAAPMMAQLFLELGLPLDWVEEAEAIRVDTLLNLAGTFFVEDARVATDDDGRKIIGAQDFVEEHGVRSVFGLGGSWSDGGFFSLIGFTNQQLTREVASRFLPMSEVFHRVTSARKLEGRLFPAPVDE